MVGAVDKPSVRGGFVLEHCFSGRRFQGRDCQFVVLVVPNSLVFRQASMRENANFWANCSFCPPETAKVGETEIGINSNESQSTLDSFAARSWINLGLRRGEVGARLGTD